MLRVVAVATRLAPAGTCREGRLGVGLGAVVLTGDGAGCRSDACAPAVHPVNAARSATAANVPKGKGDICRLDPTRER